MVPQHGKMPLCCRTAVAALLLLLSQHAFVLGHVMLRYPPSGLKSGTFEDLMFPAGEAQ
jgi:hypothetical protein